MAPKIWSKVPETIKMRSLFESFKTKIRKWKPECDCRRCTTYLKHAGFVLLMLFSFYLFLVPSMF